jgi:hypothetical protein
MQGMQNFLLVPDVLTRREAALDQLLQKQGHLGPKGLDANVDLLGFLNRRNKSPKGLGDSLPLGFVTQGNQDGRQPIFALTLEIEGLSGLGGIKQRTLVGSVITDQNTE